MKFGLRRRWGGGGKVDERGWECQGKRKVWAEQSRGTRDFEVIRKEREEDNIRGGLIGKTSLWRLEGLLGPGPKSSAGPLFEVFFW